MSAHKAPRPGPTPRPRHLTPPTDRGRRTTLLLLLEITVGAFVLSALVAWLLSSASTDSAPTTPATSTHAVAAKPTPAGPASPAPVGPVDAADGGVGAGTDARTGSALSAVTDQGRDGRDWTDPAVWRAAGAPVPPGWTYYGGGWSSTRVSGGLDAALSACRDRMWRSLAATRAAHGGERRTWSTGCYTRGAGGSRATVYQYATFAPAGGGSR